MNEKEIILNELRSGREIKEISKKYNISEWAIYKYKNELNSKVKVEEKYLKLKGQHGNEYEANAEGITNVNGEEVNIKNIEEAEQYIKDKINKLAEIRMELEEILQKL